MLKARSAIADKERREQKKSAEKDARVFKRLQVYLFHYRQVTKLTYLYRIESDDSNKGQELRLDGLRETRRRQ